MAERQTKTVPPKQQTLVPGSIWYFRGLAGPTDARGKPTWAFPPGRYRFIAVGKNYRQGQPLVVYEAEEDQWDSGEVLLATLSDWHRDFTCIDPVPTGALAG